MSAATFDLGKLHGGLRLPGEKRVSATGAIIRLPLPRQLILPLAQHVGEPAQPIVGIGERVLKGQLVAEADGDISAPIHASSSGKIIAIEPWPVSRRLGDKAPCITIECDGEDRAVIAAQPVQAFRSMDRDTLLLQILRGGIVGLGGAVFPTAQKLKQALTGPLDYLILNGVECEPYISCDDMLMREFGDEVVRGAQVLMHALSIDSCFLVIESDKAKALASIGVALAELNDPRIVLKQVPTIYPSGGEDQLVQLVANREVPSRGLPSDVGCVVQNVGTAAAVHRWINLGEPLISRITTVTGEGIRQPCNVMARIGTPLADVAAAAGGYNDHATALVIGGPMTGKSISTDQVPLVKATNCVLVLAEIPETGKESPCIRCGECAVVCPVQLLPQQLFWYAAADDEAKLREHGLVDCIECGCCDLVCPSHIPLTADFRQAKARVQEQADEKARAERARLRFELHNERLQREKREREHELATQKRNAQQAGPDAIRDVLLRAQESKKPPGENK
ncbi:MAG: electron transport complex subunit RsxC [Halioglobus sp.]|nr:electron transport complex subunit RsxC [Halioglobus sp.]